MPHDLIPRNLRIGQQVLFAFVDMLAKAFLTYVPEPPRDVHDQAGLAPNRLSARNSFQSPSWRWPFSRRASSRIASLSHAKPLRFIAKGSRAASHATSASSGPSTR